MVRGRLDRPELFGGLRHRRFAARARSSASARSCSRIPPSPPGAGHHSVIQLPGKDDWYIVYHRRPLGETDGNHRVTCIDRMEFDDQGLIKPVKITFEGVERVKL